MLLLISITIECLPLGIMEGFTGGVSIGESDFWRKLVPRRGDVGPEQDTETLRGRV